MSIEILAPLRAPVSSLPGLGPTLAALVARLVGGGAVRDVLFHLPVDFIDRRPTPLIKEAVPGTVATLRVWVARHEAPARKGQPHRVIIGDDSGFAEIVLFHAARLVQFPIGAKLIVSGKIELFADRITMPHPDYVALQTRDEAFPWIEPVWRLSAGVVPKVMRRAVLGALARLPALPEWQEPSVLRRRGWPGFGAALQALQAPAELPDEKPGQRLAYDELLARQIAFALVRARRRRRPGRVLAGDGRLRAAALRRFGYAPTAAQLQALAEIDADMSAPHQMLRLLQGDVGSGKTLVALLAMLAAVEAGGQAALLAPTEILAKQHFALFQRLCPVKVALLTGNVKGRARAEILDGVADGSIPILIGTHAIFQKTVDFSRLALAVIDEQHRFGVDQRLQLSAKGEAVDLLVMTATPIPRTLMLTHWGEMDVSRITEKPFGRKSVKTTLHKISQMPKVLDAIERAMLGGGRVYWVCPRVDEYIPNEHGRSRFNESADLAAVQIRFNTLKARFGDAVVLAFGQQDKDIQEASLSAFKDGKAQILVATKLVEVGVDIPEATVIVIENCERFGLAQLHQLRGRVGRGNIQSYCLLLHADKISASVKHRLKILRETNDGFLIADEDFRLRGGGDALGTKQSGLPGYLLADAERDEDLLTMARQDAILLLQRDPKLETDRGKAVKILLNLFDQRDAIQTLRAG